jgi:hypothetical protein
VAEAPGSDDSWVSYYEVLKDGQAIGKAATGLFFFDYKNSARESINARYEVRTVDGDGNRSPCVLAELTAGEPETYTALGGFSPTQGANQWKYEEAVGGAGFRAMSWDNGGYEGRWVGSGLAMVGRIWMQPGAQSDVSRKKRTAAQSAHSAQSEAGMACERLGGSPSLLLENGRISSG